MYWKSFFARWCRFVFSFPWSADSKPEIFSKAPFHLYCKKLSTTEKNDYNANLFASSDRIRIITRLYFIEFINFKTLRWSHVNVIKYSSLGCLKCGIHTDRYKFIRRPVSPSRMWILWRLIRRSQKRILWGSLYISIISS
jgi:hypothetical protein